MVFDLYSKFGLVYHGINSDQLGCDMTADLVDLISQQVKQDLVSLDLKVCMKELFNLYWFRLDSNLEV